jgi:hypothetical protein
VWLVAAVSTELAAGIVTAAGYLPIPVADSAFRTTPTRIPPPGSVGLGDPASLLG